MRASLPTTILMLASGLGWLGWPATPAEAGAPGVAQVTDSPVAPGPSEIIAPGQVVNQGQLQGQGSFLGQGAWCDEGQCDGAMDGCGAGCCAPCGCRGPRWAVTAEAIALERTTTRPVPLFTSPFNGNDMLDADNINSPLAYGPKVSAIRHGVGDYDVELSYFQVDGFTAGGYVPGLFRMTDGFGTSLLIDNGLARYTSALYNAELNLRRQLTDRFTILAGFRMVEMDEQYFSYGTETPGFVRGVGTRTFNHLWGGQIGGDFRLVNHGGPFQVNLVCKAGVFGNAAEQDYRLDVNKFPEELLGARSCSQTSFLGDASVVATYALTKHLALRGSIDTIWLTGVGLAPEQITCVNLANRTDVVNTSGAVFYYGGSLGLECRF